jgi:hypothetical protein
MPRNREDSQSFALTQAALIQAAKSWPAARVTIAANLATMRRTESCSTKYLKRWEELLDQGLDRLSEVVLAETDEAQVLCSVFPLSGILPEEERLRIIRRCWSDYRGGQSIS